MTTIKQLQDLVSLARVSFCTEHLIIAGGAPRDILNGAPVKDIDVFVNIESSEDRFASRCEWFAKEIGGKLTLRESDPNYPDIFNLADIECDNGIVQIVGLYENPIDDVVKYDFTVSQVFVTPAGVFMTPAYVEDSRAKIIRYQPSNLETAAVKRSAARLERLRLKYPASEWSFANCESLDAISAEGDKHE